MGLNLESKSNNTSGLRGDEGTYLPGRAPVQTLHGYSTKYGCTLDFFFFCLKAFPQIICLIFLRHPITKLQTKGIKLNLFFKILKSEFKFLTNPVLSYPCCSKQHLWLMFNILRQFFYSDVGLFRNILL